MKTPKAPQAVTKVHSMGELIAIRGHLEKTRTPLDISDYALVCLLMGTGTRATEPLSITLDDIHGDCILLRQTKGKRPAWCPGQQSPESPLALPATG